MEKMRLKIKKVKRKKKLGFLVLMRTNKGVKVIKRRRAKKRTKLSVV